MIESFTDAERAALRPYFTNLDGPVFALTHLPEVVKGALFARYSRSAKSLRRLFLDEFLDGLRVGTGEETVGERRATELYEKVFVEYGDDSVAQLGGVHLACEGVSNILTKVLERGRLMSYLEQSTRYVPYTDRPGEWKYRVPPEISDDPVLLPRFRETLDRSFETYARLLEEMRTFFSKRLPRGEGVAKGAWTRTVRAKALDAVRGLLPAATRSNVGIYGTGQGYENLLLRMRSDVNREVREYAGLMLTELRKVIPAFLTRVDLPERGERWSRYLSGVRDAARREAARVCDRTEPESRPAVTLTDFDPRGELKVVAAALYPASDLPDDQLERIVGDLSPEARREILTACVGERANRRHKPGRAFERTSYRFDILSDYGAFRDLQRHRILSIDWQRLSTRHGYAVPPEVTAAGFEDDYRRVMEAAADLHEELVASGHAGAAPYAVPMAYRIRYYMDMNAREAFHVIELRTTPAGHTSYRRVCQEMHRQISRIAGHRAIAAAMCYADYSEAEEGRLISEIRSEERKA